MTNIQGSQSVANQGDLIVSYNLCQNPGQTDSTVSNKYTVKNIDLQLAYVANQLFTNLQAFICFIPQGAVPTGTPSAYADVPYNHPEWIMVHRFYGPSANQNGSFPVKIKTRLSRKLDTGDRIVLIILGTNAVGSTNTFEYQGVVKYNTKAN